MVLVSFEVVVVDERSRVVDARSEVIVVDVRSPVASHQCWKHGDCEVVHLLEVDFEGACGGERVLSLGGEDGVLSFQFSSLDVSRLT
ncbi:hypothetical protein Tco_0669878 [Tanacetum coccineum]